MAFNYIINIPSNGIINYYGTDLTKIIYFGVTVWQKGEPYSASISLGNYASDDGSGTINTKQLTISNVSGASGNGITRSGNTLVANNDLTCSITLSGAVANAYGGSDVEATMDVTGGYVWIRKNGANVMTLTLRNSGSYGSGNRTPTAGSTSGSFTAKKGDVISFFGGGFAITHEPPHHPGSGFVWISNISATFNCKV